MELWRLIHCPICGAELRVEVANGGQFPEVHVLPPHTPAKAVNLCAGIASRSRSIGTGAASAGRT
jgi:hypothetical protein